MGGRRQAPPRDAARLNLASTARRLALRALGELRHPKRTLADALAALEPEDLEERERSFLHELLFGTLRRRGWLDHVLAQLGARPPDGLDAEVLDVLRLGAYQLLFTRVPAYAALSESVDLARAAAPRAAGFVNAVLRRLQREGPPAEPNPGQDPLRWLTTAGSLPLWLAERWLERLGPSRSIARARALLEPAPTHFRVNPRLDDAPARLAAAGVRAAPSLVPGALALVEGRLAGLAAQGAVYVQDAGAQIVAHLAAAEGLVLDACAAPGGKSLLLADLGFGRTHVVAADASRRRLATLAALRDRWGAERISAVAADARRPPWRTSFDSILLDAPCSGLGTLARHPDIRWRRRPRDLPRHAERQRALLEALAPLVRPGGRLVYATCSIEPEENEEVVGPFLELHPEFVPDDLPGWAEPHRDGPFLRTQPAPAGDAFFVARLRRAPRAG